jgi:uroporphyrinogen III methyltransferase/synthase
VIAAADVIVYDRLIPEAALQRARPDAELIYVGKGGDAAPVPQAETERLLVEHGKAGRTVVRLKGGDPFVFGRGGEEAEALRAAGIAFEVVPGVTAGVAGPAYAGIPVTHRGAASAVAFVTGHEDPAKPESALEWEALGAFPGTLVLYMGVGRLGSIAERLLAAGRNGDEPAAVIERGTLAQQRVVTGTLATIASVAASEGVRAPAVTVLGAVAALHERLRWFASGPLAGVTVAVTRARAQASELGARLHALGAGVVEAPAIRIVPLDGPAPEIGRYDLLCLTSANGVELLFERLAQKGLDARALGGVHVAAIGPGTARALRERGVTADTVPKTFTAEGLIQEFTAEGLIQELAGQPAGRVLLARAKDARDVLPDTLREQGAEVDVVALYETVAESLSESQLSAVSEADYVTFTSSSTVKFFLEGVGGRLPARARVVSIGPVTSAALREHGIEPDVEATRHDLDGLVQALVEDVSAGSAG